MTRIAIFTGLTLVAANSSMEFVNRELAKLIQENEKNLNQKEVEYSATTQECASVLAETAANIQHGDETIEALKADIDSNRVSADAARAEAQKTAAAIVALQDTKKGLEEALDTHKKNAAESVSDLSNTIDQLVRATKAIKAKSVDIKSTFMQLSAGSKISASARKHLDAFLQVADAPQAGSYAYETQSGGVLEILTNLEAQFRSELQEAETKALNSNHNFLMQIQQNEHETEGKASYHEDKKAAAARHASAAGAAKEDLALEQEELDANNALRAETQADCNQAAKVYKDDVRVLTAEMTAAQQVQEILSSRGEAAYHASGADDNAANAQSEQIVDSAAGVFLLQQTSSRAMSVDSVSSMLRSAAEKLSSKTLGLAATRVTMMEAAGTGAFDKISAMISNLIDKLEEEAAREQTDHGRCEDAKKANKENMDDSDQKKHNLESDVDKYTAEVSKQAAAFKEASASIAKNIEARNQADANRRAEQETNARITAESTEAMSALAEAVQVVEGFMGIDGGDAGRDVASEGMTRVLALLETMAERSGEMKAKTETEEKQQSEAHDRFGKDSKKAHAAVTKKKNQAELKKQQSASDLLRTKKDLEEEQKMNSSLLEESAIIVEKCNPKLSFEDRRARREQEIKNLQDAVEMLEARQ